MQKWLIVGALALLAGCKKEPVRCSVADASFGSTPDLLTFDKATTTVEFPSCSDGQKRRIACRQAMSGGFKCGCTVTEDNGSTHTLELRTTEDLATVDAKDFARKHCEWKLE